MTHTQSLFSILTTLFLLAAGRVASAQLCPPPTPDDTALADKQRADLYCEGDALSASPRVDVGDCGDASIQIWPNGIIQYTKDVSAKVARQSICLRDYVGATGSWGSENRIIIQIASVSGAVRQSDSMAHRRTLACFQAKSNTAYTLPEDSSGAVQVRVFATWNQSDSDETAFINARIDPLIKDYEVKKKAADAAPTDKTLAEASKAADDVASAWQQVRALLSNGHVQMPVFSASLPTSGSSFKLVALGSGSGARSGRVDIADGQSLMVFAYDIAWTASDSIGIVRGSPLQSQSAFAAIFKALSAISPVAKGLAINQFACPLPIKEDKVLGALQAWVRSGKESATYTAHTQTSSVDGGYSYRVQLCRRQAAASQSDTGTSGQKDAACDVSTSPDNITASFTFPVSARHRYVSAALEMAWSAPGPQPVSGYAYEPVAEAGPDQLFQLSKQTHETDEVTTNALLVVYPVAMVEGRDSTTCNGRSLWCWDGMLGLGFGPTLLRGANTEFAKQWNMRVLLELAPSVLLSIGPSLRFVDVPVGTSAGSLASVSRSSSGSTNPPGFATTQTSEWLFSTGLVLDLAALSDLAADATSAVKNATK